MKRILALLCAALLLVSCGAVREQDYAAFAPEENKRLNIYTSHKAEVYEPIIREFEQRTGIWVDITADGTETLLEAIAAGDSGCDLMLGGGADSLSAFGEYFQSYAGAEKANVENKFLDAEDRWSPFSALPVVLVYNPVLVRVNPPEGWESLLDEAWKGKIALADPRVSGSGYTAVCTLLQALPGGERETLERLIENLDGTIMPDSGDVIGRISEGKSFLGVTLEETALKAIAAGYDIAIVYPKEGTSALPDGAAIVKGCSHQKNAEMFIDFIQGKDVQSRLAERFCRRSVRSDVSLPAYMPENVALIDYDLERAGAGKTEILALWTELMGESGL